MFTMVLTEINYYPNVHGKLKKREWKAPRTADEASGNTLVQLGYVNPCSLTAWMLSEKLGENPI